MSPTPIFSWLFICYAAFGVALQIGVIYMIRAKQWSFLLLIPLILAAQWLFITAYAKAPNFTAQWFLTAALSSSLSVIFGVVLFGDRLGWAQYSGIVIIMIGLALLMHR